MLHDQQDTDAVMEHLRRLELALEELISRLDAGLKHSSAIRETHYKQQLRYERITAFTIIIAGLFLLAMLAVNVIHEW